MCSQSAPVVEYGAGIYQTANDFAVFINNCTACTNLADNFSCLRQIATRDNPAEIAAFQIRRRCRKINGKAYNFSFRIGNFAICAHPADNIFFINNFSVIGYKADIFAIVVKRESGIDNLAYNLVVFVVDIAISPDKTDCFRIKIRHTAARRNTPDKFTFK